MYLDECTQKRKNVMHIRSNRKQSYRNRTKEKVVLLNLFYQAFFSLKTIFRYTCIVHVTTKKYRPDLKKLFIFVTPINFKE